MSIFEQKIKNAKTREEVLNMPNYDLEEGECIEIKAKYMGLSTESVKIMFQTRKQIHELNLERGFSGIGISYEMAMSV